METPQTHAVEDDLQFVRQALDRDSRSPFPRAIGLLWAAIALAGFPLLDFAPRYALPFWAIAGPAGFVVTVWLARRGARAAGEADRAEAGRWQSHWLGLLQAAGVPSSPINDVGQALADPQAAARGLLLETEHPHWGTVKQVGSPVRFGEPFTEHRRAPHRNEHQDDVTSLLGYSPAKVAELAAAGAFGRQES